MFLAAVKIFNAGHLRYTWIRYLRERHSIDDVFDVLDEEIVRALSSANILESMSGRLQSPIWLRVVPPWFTDENGDPLILCDRTKAFYLSTAYSPDDREMFGRLGLKTLSPKDFLTDLRLFIEEVPGAFQRMPDRWHSQLAKVLRQILDQDRRWISTICSLALVRLHNDQWIACDDVAIHIPHMHDVSAGVDGIDLYQVHVQVVMDHHRRELVGLLGGKTYEKSHICDQILYTHTTRYAKSPLESLDMLISHAMYLLRCRWKGETLQDMQVVTENGRCIASSRAYLDSDDPLSATKLLNRERKKFHFLSTLYKVRLEPVSATWDEYLQDSFRVQVYPRLIELSKPLEYSFTTEFKHISTNESTTTILCLLKLGWAKYSAYLVPRGTSAHTHPVLEESRKVLRETIAQLPVLCRGGSIAPLSETVLPRCEVELEDMASTNILDVPEPEDPQWLFLETFGVMIESGASALFEYLRRLRAQKVSLDQIKNIYASLHELSKTEGDSIKYVLISHFPFKQFSLLIPFYLGPLSPRRTSFTFQAKVRRTSLDGRTS